MGFFGGIGNALKKVAGVALPIVGGVIGGPLGAAAGGALGGAIKGGGVKGAISGAVEGGLSKTGGIGGAAKGAVKSGVGSAVKGAIGQSARDAMMDAIRGNAGGYAAAAGGDPAAGGGGWRDKIRGAVGSITGNPDTLRTVTGAVGSGLGALQQQRQFEAAQKLRTRQLDDDILSSTQDRRISEDERLRKDAEFQRMKKQDAQYSPQRQAIVANLLSRLGMGGGLS